MKFNEFIELDNPSQQVLVSPPLDQALKILNNGKSIRILISDSLKSDVTYNINFGKSIKDNHEGNVLTDFSYVFSTGPVLDSLEISGILFNQEDGSPAVDYLCLLFNDRCDTCLISNRPDYFSISDKDGNYKIKNLHPGIYTLFFLKDANYNYKFDLTNERVGFYSGEISLNDSSVVLSKCYTFKQRANINTLIGVDFTNYFVVNLAFQNPVKNIYIQSSITDTAAKAIFNTTHDTLTYIHSNTHIDSFRLYIQLDSIIFDTVTIFQKGSTSITKPAFIPNSAPKSNKKGEAPIVHKQALNKPLVISFDMPVKLATMENVMIKLDSQTTPIPFKLEKSKDDPRKFFIQAAWKENSMYKLVIKEGAFVNFLNDSCINSEETFYTRAQNDYGSIILTNDIKSVYDDYRVKVSNELGQVIFTKRIRESDREIIVKNLPEGYYRIDVIEDLNHNGDLDPGSIISKRQPERIFSLGDKLQLKAGWELEVSIQIENQ